MEHDMFPVMSGGLSEDLAGCFSLLTWLQVFLHTPSPVSKNLKVFKPWNTHCGMLGRARVTLNVCHTHTHFFFFSCPLLLQGVGVLGPLLNPFLSFANLSISLTVFPFSLPSSSITSSHAFLGRPLPLLPIVSPWFPLLCHPHYMSVPL